MSVYLRAADMAAAAVRAAREEREERARSAPAPAMAGDEYRVELVPAAEAQNSEAVVLLTELVSRLREPQRSEQMIKAGDIADALGALVDHLRSGAP